MNARKEESRRVLMIEHDNNSYKIIYENRQRKWWHIATILLSCRSIPFRSKVCFSGGGPLQSPFRDADFGLVVIGAADTGQVVVEIGDGLLEHGRLITNYELRVTNYE